MWSAAFWKDTFDRTVRTCAETALGLITAAGADVLDLTTKASAVVIGTSAVVTVLACVVASGVGTKGTAASTSVVSYE